MTETMGFMGVGRIFTEGKLGDFSKIFLGGDQKWQNLFFSHSKLRKQPFFAKIFKIQGFFGPPAHLPTPMMGLLLICTPSYMSH